MWGIGVAGSHKCLLILTDWSNHEKHYVEVGSTGSTECLGPAQAAAGFVALPDTGFSSSAYTNCFNDGRTSSDPKGNFGSYPISTTQLPTASQNNICWVAKPTSEVVAPKAGYTIVGARTVTIPTQTGGAGNIGTLLDYAWRNASTNMCIIGTRVTMISADHDSGTAGTQLFEVNDIARGGFSGSGTVSVAYTLFNTTGNTSPIFRVGRTYTSVQHRAFRYDNLTNKALNGTNYLDLPTKNSVTANISGENSPIASGTDASTTSATQDAVVNSNWVDFTLDSVYTDDDNSTNAVSGFTYVEAPCTAAPTVQSNAIRLRQTAQEYANFKEISLSGYAIGTP